MSDWDRTAGAPPKASGTAVFLQVAAGIVLVLVLHVAAGLVLGALAFVGQATGIDAMFGVAAGIGYVWLLGIGVTQLAYVVPVFVALLFVRRAVALGVAIGAALTLVLNGSCYGLFCLAMAGSNF